MPEPLTFIPLDQVAARQPKPYVRPDVWTWPEVTADPKFQQADTGKRLEVLDNWAQNIQENRDRIPNFDAGLFYDKVQAQRAAIAGSETAGEWTKKTAKTLPASIRDSLLGTAMFIGEHADMTPLSEGRERKTPITNAMVGNVATFVEGKVTNNSAETDTLKKMTAEFRDAVGREQFPKRPDEARKWFTDWERKLRDQSKLAFPPLVQGEEIDEDLLSKRRSLTNYEPNLQGIAAFISTKNPSYIDAVLDRVVGSPGRAITRDMIERETKGMPEWRKRAFAAGADPVNVAMTIASLGVGSAVAAPLKAGTSARKAALLRTGAVVADAELNAMGERVSSWLENGQASDAELDEAAKQGRFAAYLFAGMGFTARKVAGKFSNPRSPAPAKPEGKAAPATDAPAPQVATPASRADLPTVADDSPAPPVVLRDPTARENWAPPGSEPVEMEGAPSPRERMTMNLEAQGQRGPLNQMSPARASGDVMPRTLDPVPESPATLEAQAERAAAGKRYAVLVTKGEEVPGNMPERFQSVEVAEGKVFYDPQVFDAESIKEAATANQLGEVLGYGVPAKAADADRAVVQRDANGTEVAAVAVNPEQVPAATAALESASLPGDTVAVESPAQVVQDRLAAQEVSNDTTAAARRRTPPPGIPLLERGTGDIWNFLEENPIRIPRPKELQERRRRGMKGGEYNIQWAKGVPPRYMAVFSQNGRAVDLVIRDAYRKKLIPDDTIEALKAEMDKALAYRLKTKKDVAAQEQRFKAIEKFSADARPQKGRVTVDPRSLDIGDEVVLANGKKMTVDHIDNGAIYFDGKEAYGGAQVQWQLDTHFGAARVTRQKRPPGINKDRSPEAQAARFMEATRSDQGGKLPVPVQALQVGDTITIDGTPAKVVEVDFNDFTGIADGVVIEDGRRFGVQRLADGSVIYAEKVDRPKGTPKLNPDRAKSAAADLAAETNRSRIEAPKPLAKLLEADEPPVFRTDDAPRQEFDEDGYDLPAPQSPEQAADFNLESVDPATLQAERTTAKQRDTIAEGRARRLSAGELDTTGDFLDPLAADNPLFTQRRGASGGEAIEAAARGAARGAGASIGPGASSAAEWRPHKLTARLANDPSLTPRTRELLADGNHVYVRITHAQTIDEARALVQGRGGISAAMDILADQTVPARVRIAVAGIANDVLDAERANAPSETAQARIDDLLDDLYRATNRINLELGQGVDANKLIGKLQAGRVLDELAESVETRIRQGRTSPLADAVKPRADGKPLVAQDILDAMPEEIKTKVRDLTARIRQAPEGIYKADLNRQLLAEIARWEGVDILALGEEYWMANLLSGLNTQAVNVWGNGTNLLLRTTIAALANGDTATVAHMFDGMVKGAKEGGRDFIRAWQGKDIEKFQEKYGTMDPEMPDDGKSRTADHNKLRSMRQSALENFSMMFDGRTDIKARAARAFTLGKYIFRALGGMDAFFWRTAYEGRVTLAAARHARSVDPRIQGTNLAHYLSEVLHNGQTEAAAAMAQATKEAADLRLNATKRDIEARAFEIMDNKRPDDMRAEARRYADLNTFTNKPEGSMGIVANLVNKAVREWVWSTRFGDVRWLKAIFPFVNTIANVTSGLMDFTPVGIWRGVNGGHIIGADPMKFSAIEARERLIAGTMGTVVAGLLYAYSKLSEEDEDLAFDITGEGPTDPEKIRQLRNQGWIPYSVKVGNTYLSYKESPMGLMLALVGGVRDLERYSGKYSQSDAMARAAYVLGVVPQAVTQQSMLQGFEGLSGWMSGQPGKMKRLFTGTVKGFVPWVGMQRDIGRLFDPTVVDAKTLHGAILKDVPVIRRALNEPALNAFGEPVRTVGLGRIPVISRIASSRVKDADVEFLAEHGLWLPGHGEITNVGAGLETKGERQYIARLVENRVQKMGRMSAGILTDAETRQYLKTNGEYLRMGLKYMRQRQANGIGPKDKEGMQEEVKRISDISRKAAMRDLLGLPQRAAQRSKR